jgi:YfiH family protein
MTVLPASIGGTWAWRHERGPLRVLFAGRGPSREAAEILARFAPSPPALAWVRQVHSATVLPARPGACGDGDALVASEAGLALAIITADCVPVVLAGPEGIAAVHAGWRGLADGILPAAVAAATRQPAAWSAWIGPAIGPCCYEVGEEVAERIVAASAPEVAAPGPSGRPYLDLQRAARIQLERAGVGEIAAVAACTRCEEEKLWSYRRDGKGGGRNVAFVWREA